MSGASSISSINGECSRLVANDNVVSPAATAT